MPRKPAAGFVRPEPDPRARAAESERLAAAATDDDERETALLEAADWWTRAEDFDKAQEIYGRLLDAGPRDPAMVTAFHISALWAQGRRDEARTAARALRSAHPTDMATWEIVGEAFEEDEPGEAAHWYTAGVARLLGPGPDPEPEDIGFDAEQLLTARHRARRALSEPHDAWDELADACYAQRPAAIRAGARLDDLSAHRAPSDTDSMSAEELRAEQARLEAEQEELLEEIGLLRATPPATAVPLAALFWSAREFPRALRRWPALADDYGTAFEDHRLRVEATLRRLSDEGAPRLAVAPATVEDLAEYADAEGSPADARPLRAALAADLARRGKVRPWPPPRNAPCWCDSGRKYKKCCGNPALELPPATADD